MWALAPLLGGWFWIADLLANLAPWALPFALTGAALLLRRKRRLLALLALAPMVLIGAWMSLGRARSAPARSAELTVLQCNALTTRASPDPLVRLLLTTDADVVAISEAPRGLVDRIRTDPDLAKRFPHRELPRWDLTHTRLILSRWPLEPLIERATLPRGDPRRGLRLVRVSHPSGPLVVLAFHPRSPRTPARWRDGNALVRVAMQSLREHAGSEPAVVLADLNSTPTGHRSRLLWAEAGLRRCKPVTAPAGTFPAWLPWPLALAIDDAWVSRHWRVASWRTIGGLGSDHRAVEVRLTRAPE